MDNISKHVKIVTGHATLSFRREEQDYIIAVDSGIGCLRNLEIIPDCLIGDLDSAIAADVQWAKNEGVLILQYPTDKDQVDTELALEHAYKQQPINMITIYNDMDGRFDHTMALVYLLLHPLEKKIPCRIVNKNNQIHLVDTYQRLPASHAYVSILPFTPQAKATATGLKYLLPETLYAHTPIGISNEFIKEEAEIIVKQGIILLIVSKIV